jgi:5-methylcytosine-specific restriction endonuclease McrA
MEPSDISDDELLSRVTKLTGSLRELTAQLVEHLAEVEARRLHLVAGYSSMFDFCQKKLGMSEGEAFRRILAARLSRRFPLVLSLLASGDVSLSTLELVRDRLTEENHGELLGAVANKQKREVAQYLATRFPRPDQPSRIQELRSIEPLSEARFKVEFTASDELRRKLELCQDLMSHANPSRDLGIVIERAVDLLLSELERKRLGQAKRPRRESSEGVEPRERQREFSHATKPSRVTTRVRREVFERDGLQCTYVARDGLRCEARAYLELDHIDPRALGGSNDATNLRVRCRAHNQLWAEQSFGRERVERARHFRQKRSAPASAGASDAGGVSDAGGRHGRATRASDAGAGVSDASTGVFEKVHRALRTMGFRDDEARRAVAAVARTHEANETLVVEEALRAAILFATAA